jgi:peptidoglycan hydrolase CwlO-like protein
MSGGGRPNKGKIGPQETKSKLAGGNTHLVSQNDVEKLDKIIQDLEIKLRETQSKIFDLQLNVQNCHGQIDELNKVVRQCSSHINVRYFILDKKFRRVSNFLNFRHGKKKKFN